MLFNKDRFRMAQWLFLSLVVYALAAYLATVPAETDAGLFPRMQTVLWKVGHLNLAAFIGYWIDRNAFKSGRLGKAGVFPDNPLSHIRRAIIIGATMLAFGMAI